MHIKELNYSRQSRERLQSPESRKWFGILEIQGPSSHKVFFLTYLIYFNFTTLNS